MKYVLKFSKMFEHKINESVHPKKPIETSGKILATNSCSYVHSDDNTDYNLQKIARVYLDNNDNQTLWMSLRQEGTVSGIEKNEILYLGKIGTLNKPDYPLVTDLLKPDGKNHGHFKPNFTFSPNGWKTLSNVKGFLNDILKNIRS